MAIPISPPTMRLSRILAECFLSFFQRLVSLGVSRRLATVDKLLVGGLKIGGRGAHAPTLKSKDNSISSAPPVDMKSKGEGGLKNKKRKKMGGLSSSFIYTC